MRQAPPTLSSVRGGPEKEKAFEEVVLEGTRSKKTKYDLQQISIRKTGEK